MFHEEVVAELDELLILQLKLRNKEHGTPNTTTMLKKTAALFMRS